MKMDAAMRFEKEQILTELGGYSADALTKMFLLVEALYIEGAFMTKHNGKYYLQYDCPGIQYNIYADGVYVSDGPFGTFHRQKSNPFSSVPGGFTTRLRKRLPIRWTTLPWLLWWTTWKRDKRHHP